MISSFFSRPKANRGRIAGLFFLAGLLLLPVSSSIGVESRSEKAAQAAGEREAEIQQRRSEVDAFKQGIENAETPEEKRTLIEGFREQNEARLEQLRAKHPRSELPTQSPAEMVAKMKQAAAGNPEMLTRAEEIETRFAENEEVKLKLARIRQADGQEKRVLVEELQAERAQQSKTREQKARNQARETTKGNQEAKPLPPEVQARLALMEEQKQAVERIREKMKAGDANQKRAAINELRELQEKRKEDLQDLRQQRERTHKSKPVKPATRSTRS